MIPKLGVNIDHIATLRQLRNTPYPSILEAAEIVQQAGADQITVHLREDRRHIQDADVKALRKSLRIPLNLEMACSDAMTGFACRVRPDWSCLVPEKRQEVTTEGGLDIQKNRKRVGNAVKKLKKAGIQVSLFIEPSLNSVKLSHELGADAIEFHTGRLCLAAQGALGTRSKKTFVSELRRLETAAIAAKKAGMKVHAGHGFDYENVRAVVALSDQDGPLIEEYNIGHSIICRAAILGLERAVREMLAMIQNP